jgi:hypothetical protein
VNELKDLRKRLKRARSDVSGRMNSKSIDRLALALGVRIQGIARPNRKSITRGREAIAAFVEKSDCICDAIEAATSRTEERKEKDRKDQIYEMSLLVRALRDIWKTHGDAFNDSIATSTLERLCRKLKPDELEKLGKHKLPKKIARAIERADKAYSQEDDASDNG